VTSEARRPPAIVVLGSINLDVVVDLDHLPVPGETIIAEHVRRNVGGKGANQAVAARLAGAGVEFVGRVGDDANADILRDGLDAYGVGNGHLREVAGAESGVAFINVADHDNTIVVVAGANWSWNEHHDDTDALVANADVVICQLEVPDETIERTARLTGARFVLNAAPARSISDEVLERCDPLVVNEHELAFLSGREIASHDDALAAQAQLMARGARSVVTTLGPDGAVWTAPDEQGIQPAPQVDVHDTTGAGDVFIGHLATRLGSGASLRQAVSWATAAATWSVQVAGTHSSYPDLNQAVEALNVLPEPTLFPR
jgi:ribokinase